MIAAIVLAVFIGMLVGMAIVLLVGVWLRPQVRPYEWRAESFENPPDWLKFERISFGSLRGDW